MSSGHQIKVERRGPIIADNKKSQKEVAIAEELRT